MLALAVAIISIIKPSGNAGDRPATPAASAAKPATPQHKICANNDCTDDEVLASVSNPATRRCVEKGIAYYKSMDAYPILISPPNAGRRSAEVARDKCNNSQFAF